MDLRKMAWMVMAGGLVLLNVLGESPARPSVSESPTAPGSISQGMTLVAEGRLAEALPILESEIARSPDDPKLGLARAQCLLDLARWDEALTAGQALLQRFPGDADIRIMVGETLFVSFRPSEAVEIWRSLLKDPKEGGRALPRMLGALLAQRRFEEAGRLATEAKSQGVTFDDASLNLAAQACGCPEKLFFLADLAKRHPGDPAPEEELKVQGGLCDRGGTSTVAPRSTPDVIRTSFLSNEKKASLNGKETVPLAFDSGSQMVVLYAPKKLVNRLGLTALGSARFVGLGERGARLGKKCLLDSFEVGTLKLLNLPATLSVGEWRNPAVKMGLGPFLDYVVEQDHRHSRYAFWPAGTPAESIFGGKPDISLPVLWFRGIPLVPVSINGKGPYPFLFDTGASNTILAAQFCSLLGLTPSSGGFERTKGYGASGTFGVSYTDPVTLTIGGQQDPLPWVQLTEIPQRFSGPVYGFLGQDFIDDYRVVFDGPGCRIYLRAYPSKRYRDPTLNRPPANSSRPAENAMPPPQEKPAIPQTRGGPK